MRQRQACDALGLGALLWLLGGCSSETQPIAGKASPTFHEDIEPILQARCLGCHRPDAVGPMSLTTYADAKTFAAAIAAETSALRMPPWGARETDECQPPLAFRADPSLTVDQIAMIAAWAEAGAPEGDPEKAPPAYEPPSDALSGEVLDIAPATPYEVPGGADQLRCFVLDPKLAETTYVRGYTVVPGDEELVHHVIVYVDPNGDSAALADADGGYPCFGGVGAVSDPTVLGAWAPGATPFELPEDVGIPLRAGSLLVMQVHYHPHGTASGADTTRLSLRIAEKQPTSVLESYLLGNAAGSWGQGLGLLPGPNDEAGIEFAIPPGARGHVERMRFRLDLPLPSISIYGAGTHMHRAGTDMKIEVVHEADGDRECLLQTPRWDFDWQRLYTYEGSLGALPDLRSGDAVELRCTYDNSVQNPALMSQLAEQGLSQPIPIGLGESTLDEMCVAMLPVIYPNPGF